MTMPPGLRFFLLAAWIAGVAGCATATNRLTSLPEMVTDRPDFTESASVVPRGRVQLEAGYTFARDEDAGLRAAHSYPEALARVGVLDDRLEVRLGQSVLTTRPTGGADGGPAPETGLTDLYFGAKFRLADQRRGRPELALIVQSTLPTGSRDLRGDRVVPGVNCVYAWEVVPGFLSVAASTQANVPSDDSDEAFVVWTQSVSVGYSLTDRVGAFTEWFGSVSTGRSAGRASSNAIDGGVTVRISPRVQWDVRAGYFVSSWAFFGGSGLAVLF
jgi:hypothetical protein